MQTAYLAKTETGVHICGKDHEPAPVVAANPREAKESAKRILAPPQSLVKRFPPEQRSYSLDLLQLHSKSAVCDDSEAVLVSTCINRSTLLLA
jgi:hypothetical protein